MAFTLTIGLVGNDPVPVGSQTTIDENDHHMDH